MNNRIIFLLLFYIFVNADFQAQDPSPAAIIYNTNYPRGYEIASYYAGKRNIPLNQLIGIAVTTDEVITKEYYYTMIRDPIKAAIESRGIKNKIRYLVTTKGMPLKIRVNADYCDVYNQSGGGAVESFLCILFETNTDYCSTPKIINPYRDEGIPFKAFTHEFISYCPDFVSGKVSYLVSRLDAYTPEDVFAMIDRSIAADTTGTGYYVLDDHPGAQGFEPWAMKNASLNLEQMGLKQYVIYDSTTMHVLSDTLLAKPLMGYCGRGRHAINLSSTPITMGWSMENGYLGGNQFNWLPGAVFSTYESFNGYSFFFQDNGCPPGQFMGHKDDQNLVSDFIQDGGTAAIGNVWEPFVSGVSKADLLYKYYAEGHYFIDAAYMSLIFLTGMNVVVGDPLCRISNKIHPPGEDSIVLKRINLYQNFPNPFSGSTTIRYQLTVNSSVSLAVYNILGERVLHIPEELKEPGIFEQTLSFEGLPSGVYFYRLTAAGSSATGKMVFQSENRPK